MEMLRFHVLYEEAFSCVTTKTILQNLLKEAAINFLFTRWIKINFVLLVEFNLLCKYMEKPRVYFNRFLYELSAKN